MNELNEGKNNRRKDRRATVDVIDTAPIPKSHY